MEVKNSNEFNIIQKLRTKLEEYKNNNVKYVQISSSGINPIYDTEGSNKIVTDAIEIFSISAQYTKKIIRKGIK